MARLDNPRILLTNDDGITAPGFGALERIARRLSDDLWFCAPENEQSGASHSLTLNRPLRLRQREARWYSVDGTPTDCVLLAVNHLLHDRKPDLVLSGVNHGFNIGEDVTYSGTIAAAMEATLLGIRAVALSQEVGERPVDWGTAEHWGPLVLEQAMQAGWPSNVLININFPALPPDRVAGVAVTCQGKRKIGDELMERVDPRGRTYFWIGVTRNGIEVSPNSDIQALRSGRISVTPVCLDLTHYPTIDALRQVLP